MTQDQPEGLLSLITDTFNHQGQYTSSSGLLA